MFKWLKDIIDLWKEKRRYAKELKELQRKSYQKAMREQSEILGKKQAELDTNERIRQYKSKLKKRRESKKNYDPLGLHKSKDKKANDFDIFKRSF